MLARVSHLEAYRRWRLGDQPVSDLVDWITSDKPTPAMLAGTAFHKALELAGLGEFDSLEANGHTFLMPDCELALTDIREMRAERQYGPLMVSGQVDGLSGRTVTDHKTTSRFDAERYLDGAQWRFYLDIFEADVFEWNVFEIKELEPAIYSVAPPHTLRAYRYPDLRRDCAALAGGFLDFARIHLTKEDAACPARRNWPPAR